ncbi:hypothetical protein AAD018_016230 [Aestuariibius insulae]|uniref:hypothetical protein n=1 Tax=Aestuariibius insulae TaxID=2058287 RepID=UPI00345F080D
MSRPRRTSLRFPVRGVVWLAIFLFMIKAFLLFHHGQAGYDQRVSQLVEGTAFEKAGAFVLDADPVSGWLASQMNRYLSGAPAAEDTPIAIVDEDL